MRKSLLFQVMFVGVVLSASVSFADVKYVAHRGEHKLAPEGSLPAYRFAVEHKLDIMKLDLQLTKDGVVVVSHDASLKRTMGWDVQIREVTYAEIKDKGVFKSVGGYAGEKLVTLREALAVTKAMPELWLDFKYFTPAFAEQVLKEVAAAGISEDRVMIATFTKAAIMYMKEYHPAIRRVGHISISPQPDGTLKTSCSGAEIFASMDEVTAVILGYKLELGLFGVNVPSNRRLVTSETVKKLCEAGLWVSIWYVNDIETADYYRAAGADAFVTACAAPFVRVDATGVLRMRGYVTNPCLLAVLNSLEDEQEGGSLGGDAIVIMSKKERNINYLGVTKCCVIRSKVSCTRIFTPA